MCYPSCYSFHNVCTVFSCKNNPATARRLRAARLCGSSRPPDCRVRRSPSPRPSDSPCSACRSGTRANRRRASRSSTRRARRMRPRRSQRSLPNRKVSFLFVIQFLSITIWLLRLFYSQLLHLFNSSLFYPKLFHQRNEFSIILGFGFLH